MSSQPMVADPRCVFGFVLDAIGTMTQEQRGNLRTYLERYESESCQNSAPCSREGSPQVLEGYPEQALRIRRRLCRWEEDIQVGVHRHYHGEEDGGYFEEMEFAIKLSDKKPLSFHVKFFEGGYQNYWMSVDCTLFRLYGDHRTSGIHLNMLRNMLLNNEEDEAQHYFHDQWDDERCVFFIKSVVEDALSHIPFNLSVM